MNLDMSVLINQMCELFLLIALGYMLMKIQFLDTEINKKLSDFVISVSTPLLILASVFQNTGGSKLLVVQMLIISLVIFCILPIIGMMIVKLLRIPLTHKNLYVFLTMFSNAGFMGYPVVNAVLGSEAVFYAAIFNLVFNVFVYTYGIYLMNSNSRLKDFDKKTLLTPGIVLSLIAIVFYFVDFPMPSVIVNVCASVGATTTPLAMMLIGASLALIPIKEVFNNITIYLYALMRQFLVPALLYPFLALCVSNVLLRGVSLFMLAMPAGSISVLFAAQYDNDSTTAAKNVFITTLLSIISIPVISLLLGM